MNPRRPIGIPIPNDPMNRNLIQPRCMGVIMGMEGEPRVRRNQLERILLEKF
jgi:hypothetical protein